jgi:DNA-binding NtrC family response regulator
MPDVDTFIRDSPIDPAHQARPGSDLGFTIRLGASLKEVEAELILRTLAWLGGNKTRAAQILGVRRRNTYNLLERHVANRQLNRRAYRNGYSRLP